MSLKLLQMIEAITLNRGMHICVHDLSGILKHPTLALPEKYCIHSTDFCELAKKTPRGFRACMWCKIHSINMAQSTQKTGCGYCCYGLYNITMPVYIGNKICCIVYIGNLTNNYERLYESTRKLCRMTGIQVEEMLNETKKCEFFTDIQPYLNTAKLVANYILFLYENRSKQLAQQDIHWAVQSAKRDIDRALNANQTLRNAAQMYYINEQYLGRLFKQQIGISYHEYLNLQRLEWSAKQLLEESTKNISEIALNCGFQTLAYFNRQFKKHYGISPSQYRKQHILGIE